MTAAITFADVARSYGSHRVLDAVSFAVPTGSIFGLLGPNGAGKTTLMSILAGYIRIGSGSITVLGLDHRDPRLLGRFGILPQDAAFQSDLSILDQFTYLAQLGGATPAAARTEVLRVLRRVGLEDWLGRRSTELSHGMYKRLGVAQAFLNDPELVLLDEPTAGLDPANAKAVRALIRECAGSRQRTVVVSSHDMVEMQELCSHVAILRQGKLVSCGPVPELLASHCLLRVLPSRPLDTAERSALAAQPWCEAVVDGADGWMELTARDADAPIIEATMQRWLLERGIAVRQSALGRTLGDHFQAVTAKPPTGN